jgi:Fur family peroxide stress response transcriptional regulator
VRASNQELERRLSGFEAACRDAGIKLTHQRLEVFREVAATVEHPDAETVYNGVRQRVPTISLDTVYRTLWLLEDLGLITTLGPRRERARFDANLDSHHHFVCENCGLVRDFEHSEYDVLGVPEDVKRLGSVSRLSVEIRGTCRECSGGSRAGSAHRKGKGD